MKFAMPSQQTVTLQARIHWRCLSWFKAMKWPSANEVDFGDFLVVFDFKNGVAIKKFGSVETQQLATFEPQKETREVSSIRGMIVCADNRITLQQPLVDSDGKVQIDICSTDSEGVMRLQGDIHTSLTLANHFAITPKIEGRDVFLDVATCLQDKDLAVFVVSLLVFSRFSV